MPDGPAHVLDIACGTGIWLAGQIDSYQDRQIEWHGIDANESRGLAKMRAYGCSYVDTFALLRAVGVAV